MLKVGDKAPSFHLFSDERKEVKLEDFQGKNLVILFFPAAFTSVCTNQLCAARDDIAFYQGLDAAVIGVSVDSPFVLAKFREDQKINYPLLSDFNKQMSTAYDSIYQDFVFGMKGVSRRAAFVVDKEGTIRYAEVLENAGELPNFEAVKTSLEQLN